jgi:phosphate transport system ATP-binding protein
MNALETSVLTDGGFTHLDESREHLTHLSVRSLKIAYQKKAVLDDVSIDFFRGCITTLIGPSGCGKSSFLTALNKLSNLTPTCGVKGEIELDGKNILADKFSQRELSQKIGMVFQKPNPFPLTIHRNLDLPLKEHGMSCRERRNQKIEAVLREVGLWEEVHDRLHTPALHLSGGQQQRLCIARALVLEPEILLMDEPCSALDPISSRVVEELIRSLRGRLTVIIVTHNLAQARRIGDFSAFFWTHERVGRLIEFGPTKVIFDSPLHELTKAYVTGISG